MTNRIGKLRNALERNREALAALQAQQMDLLDEITREQAATEEAQQREPLTIPEAARALKLSEEYVRRLLRNGSLKGERSGRKWLIRLDTIEAYKASATQALNQKGLA